MGRQDNWELIDPEGACKMTSSTIAPRLTTLEGKTVGLYWNRKPGGQDVLDEIARLLSEEVKDIKFIRYWEAVPGATAYTEGSWSEPLDEKIIRDMVALKPDVVISSQGD